MGVYSQLLAQQGVSRLSLFIDNLARTPLSQILLLALICTLVRLALVSFLANTPTHKRDFTFSLARIADSVCDAVIYAAIIVFMLIRPFILQTFTIPSGSMIDTLRVGDVIVANKWVYRPGEPQFQDVTVFKPPTGSAVPNNQPAPKDLIKRTIGTSGHVVEIRDKQLYIDGEPIKEPYVAFTRMRNPNELAPRDLWPTIEIPNFKLVEIDGEYWPVSYYFDERMGRQLANVNPTFTAPQFSALVDHGDHMSIDEDIMKKLLDAPPAAVPPGKFLMFGDNRNGSYDSRAWGLVDDSEIVGRAEYIWFPFSRMSSID